MQPVYGIANFDLINLNEMKALNYNISWSKIQKEFAWLVTVALMIAGLPTLRNILVFILEKLYELFIQQAIRK